MSKQKTKTKTKKVYTAIILDRSGSMQGTEKETVTAFNEQVQQLKINAKNEAELFCSLVTFNGDVFEHLWNVPAEDLTPATVESYKPDGSTAMRDAIGYTVDKLRETTDTSNPSNCYFLIIISDGAENASKHYAIPALRELVEEKQKTNRWTFTYLGCSEDYLKEVAVQTGIPTSNMAAWSNATPTMATAGYRAAVSGYSGYSGAAGVFRTLTTTNATNALNVYSDGINLANYADADTVKAFTADIQMTTTTTEDPVGATGVFSNFTFADWTKYKPKK